MDRKSSPTVFGIIAIICSLPLLVVSAESIHIFSTAIEDMYINPGDINYGEAQLIGGLGFILLTITIILLASGICALRRKTWWLALTSSILTLPLIFGGILLILIINSKNEFRQPPKWTITLATIYKRIVTDKPINTTHDLEYIKEVLSCHTYKFADKEAMSQNLPWCNAPEPPEIENTYCHTFQSMTK